MKPNLNQSNLDIRGHVRLTDKKTNQVLFEGDNMILKAGREYIRQLLAKDFVSFTPDLTNHKFYKLSLGTSQIASKFENTLENHQTLELSNSVSIDVTVSVPTETEGFLKLSGTIESQEVGKTLQELGIILGGPGLSHILFSRIVINPIIVDVTTEIEVEYFVYI